MGFEVQGSGCRVEALYLGTRSLQHALPLARCGVLDRSGLALRLRQQPLALRLHAGQASAAWRLAATGGGYKDGCRDRRSWSCLRGCCLLCTLPCTLHRSRIPHNPFQLRDPNARGRLGPAASGPSRPSDGHGSERRNRREGHLPHGEKGLHQYQLGCRVFPPHGGTVLAGAGRCASHHSHGGRGPVSDRPLAPGGNTIAAGYTPVAYEPITRNQAESVRSERAVNALIVGNASVHRG